MQIAVLTFDGFNELDSFVAAAILNRLRPRGWAAHITAPSAEVTSMNGVTVARQKPIAFAAEADAVAWGRTDIEQAGQRWTQNGGELTTASPAFLRELQEQFTQATTHLMAASEALRTEVMFVRGLAQRV